MFKNKHITTSLIVAPILAILSYFATDYIVSDLPSAAKSGESYALLARPNCRYQSGQCTFVNGDIEIRLALRQSGAGEYVLLAESNTPIKGARIALNDMGEVFKSVQLKPLDESGESWQMKILNNQLASKELRIAMLAQDTLFFGDTETTFFSYETSFSREGWM